MYPRRATFLLHLASSDRRRGATLAVVCTRMIESHWLPRPPMNMAPPTVAALEAAYASVLTANGGPLGPRLPTPTWAFLCWLAEEKGLLLHGSPDPDIALFEPRTPRDRSADDFSKRTAVFATSDGIWAIFYAVLDRARPGMRLLNGALQFGNGTGEPSAMHYFFSVTRGLLREQPWRDGEIYLLPREGFEQQEPYELGGRTVIEPHWAAPTPVRPLARLRVTPHDFPFLERVREHDPVHVDRRASDDPGGFPWL